MSVDITCQEVKKQLDEGVTFHFIDVREEWEHIEQNLGATCYPLGELPQHLPQLSALKAEEIILHCKTGPRGNQAKKYLMSQGFSNVRNMIGGIKEYLQLQEAPQQAAQD
jgi:rhodanese-related sulfurtransferase